MWYKIEDKKPEHGRKVIVRTENDGNVHYHEDKYIRPSLISEFSEWQLSFDSLVTHWTESPPKEESLKEQKLKVGKKVCIEDDKDLRSIFKGFRNLEEVIKQRMEPTKQESALEHISKHTWTKWTHVDEGLPPDTCLCLVKSRKGDIGYLEATYEAGEKLFIMRDMDTKVCGIPLHVEEYLIIPTE